MKDTDTVKAQSSEPAENKEVLLSGDAVQNQKNDSEDAKEAPKRIVTPDGVEVRSEPDKKKKSKL